MDNTKATQRNQREKGDPKRERKNDKKNGLIATEIVRETIVYFWNQFYFLLNLEEIISCVMHYLGNKENVKKALAYIAILISD